MVNATQFRGTMSRDGRTLDGHGYMKRGRKEAIHLSWIVVANPNRVALADPVDIHDGLNGSLCRVCERDDIDAILSETGEMPTHAVDRDESGSVVYLYALTWS